ncbi:MAG: alpha/beta fold hydrolase [Deltaproteobacteria bacterium]|nr:MAG: alpha/beta fold hydrolase [Deltaproteobacteria bacterium]
MTTTFSAAPPLPDWLAEHFPYRRRMATVDGVRLHFVDHGEGPVVLLFHGNPTWSFLWRKVIARLDGYRVIAPDLWGLGLSDKPRSTRAHNLERHLELLTGLVRGLQIEAFITVGQDWGGPMAAGVAARDPNRVRGAVFGNTGVLAPRRPLKVTSFHRFAHTPLISDAVFRLGSFPQRGLSRVQGDRSSIGKLETRAYTWPLRRLRDRAAPLAMARMVPNREGHPTLAPMEHIDAWVRGFDGPIGLVWGTRDPILGRGLRRHREALPQARVWETEAGHFLQEEVPDELVEAIRWVDGEARAAGR